MTAQANIPFIQRIELNNLLSFGPKGIGLDLLPLNVLIGPNGSGKSNFIEAIALMRSAPSDYRDVVRRGGGVREWLWKGAPEASGHMAWVVANPEGSQPLRHDLAFQAVGQNFGLVEERVEFSKNNVCLEDYEIFYLYAQGKPLIRVQERSGASYRSVTPFSLDLDRSILAQRRDPDSYPELASLASNYERIRIYREWTFGRKAIFREPQKADLPNDVLAEDFSNLGLFLNRLKTRHPAAARAILEGLTDLYDGLTEFNVLIEGGTVQVFFTEGEFVIPATRLSDGTLRYLCLLAILCDPNPPPLVCIEEPELGLHPDVLPKLADHLLAASRRTQLIVTTHSDVLVDAMSDQPESVVICEKHDGATSMTRLVADDLQVWLEKYRLGELWIRGELGGTRW
ncbi:MAG: AAA family ATPase [Cyanobacteriota bacterium]